MSVGTQKMRTCGKKVIFFNVRGMMIWEILQSDAAFYSIVSDSDDGDPPFKKIPTLDGEKKQD